MSSKEQERVLRGFSPVASQTDLKKQPNLSLFCKPKIMPIKSPNLPLLEPMQAEANTQEVPLAGVIDGRL
jgi:hypothetical protein